ncbi:MAG: SCO family protein [Acidimicrobiia bacterium]|nr:SCO family protein [Acidimicrobiia bacterium]
MKKLMAVTAAAGLGVIVALALLAATRAPHEFTATVYSSSAPAPEFELIGDNGNPVALSQFEDEIVLLYFGYTFCPDICPASLAELATATSVLSEEEREAVQVMMVSVDPARDTPEALSEYMNFFDPAFIGLTGSDAEIAAVAADYNVYYQAEEGTAATGYLVDHWAGVYVIDRGQLIASFSFGTSGEQIAADVREWL